MAQMAERQLPNPRCQFIADAWVQIPPFRKRSRLAFDQQYIKGLPVSSKSKS